MSRAPRFALPAALALSSVLVAGCGAAADKVSEKAAEKVTEKAIESQGGGKVDIDTSGDGKVSIETEDGSVEFGSSEIPESWPDDVPLPDDLAATSTSTIGSADEKLVSVVGSTQQEPAELLAFYKDALADWTISGETTSTGSGTVLVSAQWEVEGRRVTFLASTMEDGTTSLSLGHTGQG